jgi:hypothetical protein
MQRYRLNGSKWLVRLRSLPLGVTRFRRAQCYSAAQDTTPSISDLGIHIPCVCCQRRHDGARARGREREVRDTAGRYFTILRRDLIRCSEADDSWSCPRWVLAGEGVPIARVSRQIPCSQGILQGILRFPAARKPIHCKKPLSCSDLSRISLSKLTRKKLQITGNFHNLTGNFLTPRPAPRTCIS